MYNLEKSPLLPPSFDASELKMSWDLLQNPDQRYCKTFAMRSNCAAHSGLGYYSLFYVRVILSTWYKNLIWMQFYWALWIVVLKLDFDSMDL